MLRVFSTRKAAKTRDSRMYPTTRGLLIGLAVLVVVAVAFSDLTGGMMGPGFPGQVGQEMMPGRWWTQALAMFKFWGVVLIALALVARALGVGRRRRRSPPDVLKRRDATGELPREQDEQMGKDLEQ